MHMAQTGRCGAPVGSFGEAVEFLEQGINYEKTRDWKYDKKVLDLRRTEQLLEAIGDPHRGYNIIHVAGTKGKGSTAGAAAHCLQCCGYRTGLLTSPHLITHRERACVANRMISEDAFWPIVAKMQPYVERKRMEEQEKHQRAPTYFEMLTALAFEYFAQRDVEWAVLEVGLGGRLDSTNVVTPRCCIITAIGFDHTDKLGDTPEAIAAEKGGILKEAVPVVLGRQRYEGALRTLRAMADERHCPRWEVGRELEVSDKEPMSAPVGRPDAEVGWRFSLATPGASYRDLFTPLLGAHQLDNLAAAIGAVEMTRRYAGLQVQSRQIADAIASFQIAGRIEVLKRTPGLVLDVAHTVESVEALLDALDTHFPGRPLRLVFGCSAGKKLHGMLARLLPRCVSFTATQAKLPRALPADEVAKAARESGLESSVADGVNTIADPPEAVQNALSRARPGDIVCVTGSFYVAGEVRAKWLEDHPEAAD